MNWDAIGAIGDFIGGIGVVVTLAYLAVQICQNTIALRTASRQEIASGYREVNRMLFDTQTAMAFSKGMESFSDLAFEERSRFGTYLNEEALFHQGAFALYESGQLEESTYFAYRDWFACIVATRGGQVWWNAVARPIYEAKMVATVEERVARGGLLDPRKLPMLRSDE